ncbi:uncharacterized protein [Montipora foliosa]|uniref:uncharacterized protein n=1 Tax=Montipora foliosa TaxID=591990 RepID=UPI0035F1A995
MSAEELMKDLEELTKKYEEAMEQLKAMKESPPASSTSSATSSAVGQKQIVVFPRDKKIKNFTGRKTEGDQQVEDFIDELKTTFEARDMTPAERVDFILSHLEGPAKEEVRMYSKKERSNPDFLLEVLTQAFGEKRSSSQLLKHFYEWRQKENETLRAYLYSLNELLKSVTKADPKAVPDPEKTLWDQFADNVRNPFLQKELKKFIRERNPSFLDLREKALRWSEEKERPQRSTPRPPLSQEVSVDTPEISQCSASSTNTPMDKVLDVEELTSSIRELKQPRTQNSAKEWSGQRSSIVCFRCNRNGHIARNCQKLGEGQPPVRGGPP